jgi:hypothetical protein
VKQPCSRCHRLSATLFRKTCLYFVRILQGSFGSFTTLLMNSFGWHTNAAIKRSAGKRSRGSLMHHDQTLWALKGAGSEVRKK